MIETGEASGGNCLLTTLKMRVLRAQTTETSLMRRPRTVFMTGWLVFHH